MKDNTVYANMSLGYVTIRLPLKDAHAVQALLCGKNVYKVESKYGNNKGVLELLKSYEAPTVSVHNNTIVDLCSLSDKEADEYVEKVVNPYVKDESDTMMGVEEFKALRSRV